MKKFDWDKAKDKLLQESRGIGFADVVFHIQNGNILDIIGRPNEARYANQRIIVLRMEDYAYLVPFVEDEDGWFLKTIIPSRKATKEYLG